LEEEPDPVFPQGRRWHVARWNAGSADGGGGRTENAAKHLAASSHPFSFC
jgi:hypothetical protein